MNKIIIVCSLLVASNLLHAVEEPVIQDQISITENTEANTTNYKPLSPKKTFLFQFENKNLVDVINLIAAEKGINIILPQKPPIDKLNEPKSKLTFHVEEKMSIDEAWNLLYTILDVAGYAIKPQGDMFAIIRIPEAAAGIITEPMPTFIGTPFDDLPDGDVRIRYVHYLTNMKVPGSSNVSPQDNELTAVLNHILAGSDKPSNTAGASAFFTDVNANALILVGKADTIKGAMAVIKQLDKGGFHEKMEIIKLRHTTAFDIKTLLTEKLLKAAPPAGPHMRNDTRKPSETYFAPNTRIIDETRTNSLIVVGRSQAVDRIKDFIETYIDLEPDSGKSILHVYTLLYLNAEKMVPVLTNMLDIKTSGGTEQSTTKRQQGGPERFFDDVIITSDLPAGYQPNQDEKGESKYQYSGGNRLIIAARNDDWKRIKHLIEQLDKPFPQVFIEVLIADLTIDDIRQLGQQARNPHSCLPSQINIQSAQLAAPPIVDKTVPPGTIAGDLLANVFSVQDSAGKVTGSQSLAGLAPAGSAVFSFNDDDGKTWSLLQMLRSFGATKIISHPHVVAINNQRATVANGESRLVLGEAALGATAANIKQDWIQALLKVDIVPRISPDNVINLNVDISINTFAAVNAAGFQNTILVREVHTNANVRNKSVLALGGLISTELDDIENETPLLSKIPFLGWFFKNRRAEETKANLTVFISPTIIMPNLRGGIHQHAKDYIGLAKQYAIEGSLFDSLRDPVTRWFFKTGTVEAAETMDEFVKDDESLNGIQPRPKAPGRKQQKRERRKMIAHNADKKLENRAQQLKDVIQTTETNPLLTGSRNKQTAAAA